MALFNWDWKDTHCILSVLGCYSVQHRYGSLYCHHRMVSLRNAGLDLACGGCWKSFRM